MKVRTKNSTSGTRNSSTNTASAGSISSGVRSRGADREAAEVAGYSVVAYASAAAFLNDRENQATCLIIDQHMTGLELVSRLRSDGTALPVLLITGSPSPAILAGAAQLGVEKVLEKPLDEGSTELCRDVFWNVVSPSRSSFSACPFALPRGHRPGWLQPVVGAAAPIESDPDASGNRSRTVVPTPGCDSIVMTPPDRSINVLTKARPRPVPCPGAFVVNSGSQIRSMRFAGMPAPVSETETSSQSDVGARAVAIVTLPPSGMASPAFRKRLIRLSSS